MHVSRAAGACSSSQFQVTIAHDHLLLLTCSAASTWLEPTLRVSWHKPPSLRNGLHNFRLPLLMITYCSSLALLLAPGWSPPSEYPDTSPSIFEKQMDKVRQGLLTRTMHCQVLLMLSGMGRKKGGQNAEEGIGKRKSSNANRCAIGRKQTGEFINQPQLMACARQARARVWRRCAFCPTLKYTGSTARYRLRKQTRKLS